MFCNSQFCFNPIINYSTVILYVHCVMCFHQTSMPCCNVFNFINNVQLLRTNFIFCTCSENKKIAIQIVIWKLILLFLILHCIHCMWTKKSSYVLFICLPRTYFWQGILLCIFLLNTQLCHQSNH